MMDKEFKNSGVTRLAAAMLGGALVLTGCKQPRTITAQPEQSAQVQQVQTRGGAVTAAQQLAPPTVAAPPPAPPPDPVAQSSEEPPPNIRPTVTRRRRHAPPPEIGYDIRAYQY